MLAQTADSRTIERLKNLECGVKSLDDKVSEMDIKLSHVMQISSEALETTQTGFTRVNEELHYQREQLLSTVKTMRSSMTTRFQMYLLILILFLWTVLMYLFLWN